MGYQPLAGSSYLTGGKIGLDSFGSIETTVVAPQRPHFSTGPNHELNEWGQIIHGSGDGVGVLLGIAGLLHIRIHADVDPEALAVLVERGEH